jgi:septum formation protein
MRLVLGSSSKWRRDYAKQCLGSDIELIAPDISEREIAAKLDNPSPADHVKAIAGAKLRHLLDKIESDEPSIVMCFDTIVYFNGRILEKPANREEAVATIREWGKNSHKLEVWTGLAIGLNRPMTICIEAEVATIFLVRDLREDEIPIYIDNSGAVNSCGAVIIEELSAMGAARYEGELSCIWGFPEASIKRIVGDLTKLKQ